MVKPTFSFRRCLGANIALIYDAIFMSSAARIADPHVEVGVVAGDGGCVIWPQLIGYAKAKEFLMTDDPLDAEEAERIGPGQSRNHARRHLGRGAGLRASTGQWRHGGDPLD